MTTAKKPTFIREIELRYRKRRVKADAPVEEPLTDPKMVYELFSDLQNETKEKLLAISLDTRLKMLCFEVIALGSVSSVYARAFESLRTAILVNAYGLIMVHNHPSGDVTPSLQDKQFTLDVLNHTVTGGIEFYDHIIIGRERYFSFAEQGLMKELTTIARANRPKLV